MKISRSKTEIMSTNIDGNGRDSIRLDGKEIEKKSLNTSDPSLQLMEVLKKIQNTVYRQVVNNLRAISRILCDKSAIKIEREIP